MRKAWRAAATLALVGLAGCVERRFVIESDPPGALVFENGQPIGATPVDGHFVYYGNRSFTLVKDGYETLVVNQEIKSPWYEYFPLDFASENLYPGKVEDVRRFRYPMKPLQQPNTTDLLQQAEALRQRGRALPDSGGVKPPAAGKPGAVRVEPVPPPPPVVVNPDLPQPIRP